MSDDELPERDQFYQSTPTPPVTAARRSFAEWCMTLALGVPWLWARRPPFLRSFEEARRYAVNITVLLVLGVFFVAVWKATFENTVIVEPIAMPEQLKPEGYTGTILAQHLIDRVHQIGEVADTLKERARIGSESQFAALASIQVPTAGVTLRSVISTLRDLLNIKDGKIAGDLIVQEAKSTSVTTYVLSLRLDSRAGRQISSVEGTTITEVLDKAARIVTERFDPYTMAAYLVDHDALSEAESVGIRLTASTEVEARKWGFIVLAMVREEIADWNSAEEFYQKAVQLDDRFETAHTGLAFSSVWKGDLKIAEEHVRRALKLKPGYGPAHLAWGIIKFQQGDHDAALEAFQAVRRHDPRPSRSRAVMATALMQVGRADEALELCNEAIVLNPKLGLPYTACGYIHQQRNEPDAAIAFFLKALQTGQRVAANQVYLGDTYFQKRDYEKALECYGIAVRLIPKNLDWQVQVAFTLAAMHRFDDAIMAVRELRKIRDGPTYEAYMQTFGIYRDRGNVP